jgi:hypothetical protein
MPLGAGQPKDHLSYFRHALIGKERLILSAFWQFLNGRIGQLWVDYVVSDSLSHLPTDLFQFSTYPLP